MKNYSAKKYQKSGFSLIDFAIWITIFSVMIIGFLAVSSAQNKHKNFVADNLEKQKILDKVNSYLLKEISQPGKLDINGILVHKSCNEEGSSETSICGPTSAVHNITNGLYDTDKNNLGFVPYAALGLNQEDAIDSNNKFYLFLAHQTLPDKPYQYYVFSQPEEPLSIAYLNTIKNGNEKQNNAQNNAIPAVQLSNCHITSAISKQYQQDQTIAINEDRYFDILSGATKTVDCSSYNKSDKNLYYKNNDVSTNLPSDATITFQCFSGGSDYTPTIQKCERVCKTFTTSDGANYDVGLQFFQQVVKLYPANYDALFTSLKISKSPSSFLELKCGTDYVYQVNSTPSCATGTIWNTDSKSCQCDTGAIWNADSNSCQCDAANYYVWNTDSKSCQCDAANYYVQNNQNKCVKGCKMALDVVGPGNLVDNNKLYYVDQDFSEVLADTICLNNASKNSIPFIETKLAKLKSTDNDCVLRKGTADIPFKEKLCSCNSGYSMLAENSIANFSSNYSVTAFQAFPGVAVPNSPSKLARRNFAAKYDCFLMCSATTNDLSKQNVVDSKGNLTNLAIGYHKYGLTARQLAIINGLNIINYKEYGTPITIIPNLFYDGVNKKTLQPLNCSTSSGNNINYCLDTNVNKTVKRLFSSSCASFKESLPFLQIKSGGSF